MGSGHYLLTSGARVLGAILGGWVPHVPVLAAFFLSLFTFLPVIDGVWPRRSPLKLLEQSMTQSKVLKSLVN